MTDIFPRHPETGTGDREVKITERATSFVLKEGCVDFRTFRLSKLENPRPTTPGLMETGSTDDVLMKYRKRKDLVHRLFDKKYVEVPYTILYTDKDGTFGDFSTPDGQDAFAESDMRIDDGDGGIPEWAKELHRFARLKLARRFSLDEELTALRGLERVGGKFRFTVGMSRYSDAFFSMGSEGVSLEFTQKDRDELTKKNVSSEWMAELESLLARLQASYGSGTTIRDVILKKTNGLPSYDRRIHHYLLGVAGTVLTSDGNVVFVNRGAGVSVNRGINVTASGAVKFQKDFLDRYGLPHHLGKQMHEEAKEEIGLASGDLLLGAMKRRIALELGVNEGEYDLIPVGMARELPRGGSPEVMFMIQFKKDTHELIKRIANNPHDDCAEIDSDVHVYPMERVSELLRQKDAGRVVHHKGLLNLMMMVRYLSQNS